VSAHSAVEIQDLRVRRGNRQVLHRVSLTIEAGKVTGLLGPSGSGKTTLLRAIAGVQIIESGTVRVLGEPAGAPTVQLADAADRVVHTLSGGEQARVSLATALVSQPRVLILDEPTVGLDPVLRRDLWATFRRLADDGAALLVSSHVMDEADYCDELLLMRDGAILARGAPDDLRELTNTEDLAATFLHLIESGP
jgi:ABC-2 type transport system ATP-binding protein